MKSNPIGCFASLETNISNDQSELNEGLIRKEVVEERCNEETQSEVLKYQAGVIAEGRGGGGKTKRSKGSCTIVCLMIMTAIKRTRGTADTC